MQPVDWGEAFRIVGGNLFVTFVIMGLLATLTHYMGKMFQRMEANKKAKAKAAAASKEAKA